MFLLLRKHLGKIDQPIRALVAEAVKLIDDENMAAFIQKEYLY